MSRVENAHRNRLGPPVHKLKVRQNVRRDIEVVLYRVCLHGRDARAGMGKSDRPGMLTAAAAKVQHVGVVEGEPPVVHEKFRAYVRRCGVADLHKHVVAGGCISAGMN